MSAIDQLFRDLKASGRKALMPFITAGDPDLDFTRRVIEELGKRGCSLCELGIPYSDPIADGPVIQASYARALDGGVRLQNILEMTRSVAPKLEMPIVTMVSYAIVYRHGTEAYIDEVKQAGVAGLIVPDLPVDESEPLAKLCAEAGLSLIQLVTPTTPKERAVRIARTSTGFLYYVSVAGITGERSDLPADLVENVAWLRGQTDLPICIGFGISQPEHIRQLAPVADGLIVGSAIVRRLEKASEEPHDAVIRDVGEYVASLLSAMDP